MECLLSEDSTYTLCLSLSLQHDIRIIGCKKKRYMNDIHNDTMQNNNQKSPFVNKALPYIFGRTMASSRSSRRDRAGSDDGPPL